jgi:uncharacterized protein (DUF983 family)
MDGHRIEVHRTRWSSFWDGFCLRCPACGTGHLYQGFRRQRACDRCGVVFEGEPGQFTGAVYLCLMATQIGFGLIWLLMETYAHLSVGQEVAIGIAWAIAFPALVYRHTLGFFVAVVHANTGLTADAPHAPHAPQADSLT